MSFVTSALVRGAGWRDSADSLRYGSLRIKNFRWFVVGLLLSMMGTFMQAVAQLWIVLDLTNSGTAIGVVTTLQWIPMVFLGPWGGLIADSMDRRRLLMVTQTLAGACAVALALLVGSGVVELWMVYVIALCLGVVTSIDLPARQAFVYDLVGDADIADATGVQLAISNLARAIGPAAAGLLIAGVGAELCFWLNAGSFAVALVGLWMMDPSALQPRTVALRERGQIRAGLKYVAAVPEIRALVIAAALLFGFGFQYELTVTLFAERIFDGGSAMYGVLMSIVGVGAIVGALWISRRGRASANAYPWISGVLAASLVAFAASPNPLVAGVALAVGGGAVSAAATVAYSYLNQTVAESMRARVIAVWMVAAVGVRPISGPLLGWVGEGLGPRAAVLLAAAVVAASAPLFSILARTGRNGARDAAAHTPGPRGGR